MEDAFGSFKTIFNTAKGGLEPSSIYARSAVLLPFLFTIHRIEVSELQVLISDFHSNTWQARWSSEMLQKLRQDLQCNEDFESFIHRIQAAFSSDSVKIELGGPASAVCGEGATSAKLKSKIKFEDWEKEISFSLESWFGRTANDAMGVLALGVFDALQEEKQKSAHFQSIQHQTNQLLYLPEASAQPSIQITHSHASTEDATVSNYNVPPIMDYPPPSETLAIAHTPEKAILNVIKSHTPHSRIPRLSSASPSSLSSMDAPPVAPSPTTAEGALFKSSKKRAFRTADPDKIAYIMSMASDENRSFSTKIQCRPPRRISQPSRTSGYSETSPVDQIPAIAELENKPEFGVSGDTLTVRSDEKAGLDQTSQESLKRLRDFRESESTLLNDAWSRRVFDEWREEMDRPTRGRRIEDMMHKELNDELVVFFQEVCKTNGDLYPAGSLSNMYLSFQRILRADQIKREEETGITEPLVNMRDNLVFLPALKSLELAIQTSRLAGAEPEPRSRKGIPDMNKVQSILAHPSNSMDNPQGLFTRVFCYLVSRFHVHRVDDLWKLMDSEFERGVDDMGVPYWDFHPTVTDHKTGLQSIRVSDPDTVLCFDEFFRRRPEPDRTPDNSSIPRRFLLRPKDRTPPNDAWFLPSNVGRSMIRSLLSIMSGKSSDVESTNYGGEEINITTD